MEKMCVIGAGSWGSALALSLHKIIIKFSCGQEIMSKLRK